MNGGAMVVTPLYVALLVLGFVVLSGRVIQHRRAGVKVKSGAGALVTVLRLTENP